jgi:NAD(P)H-dependent FMN reductase
VRKPAAFVGYGSVGGARSVEHLRLITVELQMVSVRNAVHITGTSLSDAGNLVERSYRAAGSNLDQ